MSSTQPTSSTVQSEVKKLTQWLERVGDAMTQTEVEKVLKITRRRIGQLRKSKELESGTFLGSVLISTRSIEAFKKKGTSERVKAPVSPRAWAKFLRVLKKGKDVKAACGAAEISRTAAYLRRQSDPSFRVQWDLALKGRK